MLSRTIESQVAAYSTITTLIKQIGFSPKLATLDNETSDFLLQSLENTDIAINLVPPHVHRRNAAERDIQTFKAHFIAILCGMDPKFSLNLWYKLLPQTQITLNLLRNSRVNPLLSAYCQIWGNFDFNQKNLAPLGTKLLVHIKPKVRESWAPRATNAWYIGPALPHYRCYLIWIIDTNTERISDSIAWFPHYTNIPVYTNQSTILSATHKLTQVLLQPRLSASFFPLAHNHF